jgi:hypothetical protein
MMKKNKRKLTLYQPATYQIKVPEALDRRWSEWYTGMSIAVGKDGNGLSVTTLIVTVDQAALQSLLRRLYSLGLPLVSVICIEIK